MTGKQQKMIARLKKRLISLLQLLLVLIFIIFEELIWEGIARPIYERIHALNILQKIEAGLKQVNPAVILFIFVMLLATVETFGIYAGILFMSGHILLGLGLYLSKIPVAAFTFWLFRTTEDKLMQFGWFKWFYEKIMAVIGWLKELAIYQETMAKLKAVKLRIKVWTAHIKATYFKGESPFLKRLKQHYANLKEYLDK